MSLNKNLNLLELSNNQLLALVDDKENEISSLKTKLSLLEQNITLLESNPGTFSLKEIIALMPGNVFWKNKDGVYLGCNNTLAKFLGFKSPDEIIGKRNVTLQL